MSNAYKSAGVDVEAGYEAVKLMKEHVAKTVIPGVLGGLGGFGGLFEIDVKKYEELVLVSGTDGVGTKLKIAMLTGVCDTIGQDCVAMCVNDVICGGAKPLFFLDYIAVGKNDPKTVADIVKGIADGCVLSGCALVGGETAEMPGFYKPDEYDVAGFTVGAVEKSKIIDGTKIKAGDVVIGMPSSGVHSNGFSLVRKVFNISDDNGASRLNIAFDEFGDKTLGEVLLKPTKIYVKQMLSVIENFDVKGVSHITGGGFYENLPRMLPKNVGVKIDKKSFPKLPIFDVIQRTSNISEDDMYGTFNMGIGMAFVVDKNQSVNVINHLKELGEDAYLIGEITETVGVSVC